MESESESIALNELYEHTAKELAHIGFGFYSNGWLYGTSGNLSTVLRREPLLIAITGSGLDKGHLEPGHIIHIDREQNVLRGDYRPSAETSLHLAIIEETGANSVFHTHSTWSTILSKKHEEGGEIELEGYEMLKGLEGVKTHEHRELLPVFKNSQDMVSLSSKVRETLRKNPSLHGFLLGGHGLYTWGSDPQEAKRHVEVLEFLLEVYGKC